jgi:hypothetical protein
VPTQQAAESRRIAAMNEMTGQVHVQDAGGGRGTESLTAGA